MVWWLVMFDVEAVVGFSSSFSVFLGESFSDFGYIPAVMGFLAGPYGKVNYEPPAVLMKAEF